MKIKKKVNLCESCEHYFMNPFDQYFCANKRLELKTARYKCAQYKKNKK